MGSASWAGPSSLGRMKDSYWVLRRSQRKKRWLKECCRLVKVSKLSLGADVLSTWIHPGLNFPRINPDHLFSRGGWLVRTELRLNRSKFRNSFSLCSLFFVAIAHGHCDDCFHVHYNPRAAILALLGDASGKHSNDWEKRNLMKLLSALPRRWNLIRCKGYGLSPRIPQARASQLFQPKCFFCASATTTT
ncbi:uncharacterized protein LOC112351657 [Selaginella moellendorffii]|uniref:uncharacterized protein LOC112351657 n=1 Tax=Selaginella moellendorffii TaxID=88036 RepID=UPI000D1CAA0F|nr:uncharacterized protein LOC112351657 [Selaginella moellendorffii]|eukprot:XP_024545685.1 uncharacterized protein LOC112351657 [Selaginella moellendorffii]